MHNENKTEAVNPKDWPPLSITAPCRPHRRKEKREHKMILRQELPKDYERVCRLITESFATAEHADGNEADLVAALRKGPSFVPALSRVAEIQGEIVGHILLTKAHVGSTTVLALAPLSVKPQFQRQGIGRALILDGHAVAKRLGFSYVLVLGSRAYYTRFGYAPAAQFHIEAPMGIPSDHLMAICLRENSDPIHGTLIYRKEFGL